MLISAQTSEFMGSDVTSLARCGKICGGAGKNHGGPGGLSFGGLADCEFGASRLQVGVARIVICKYGPLPALSILTWWFPRILCFNWGRSDSELCFTAFQKRVFWRGPPHFLSSSAVPHHSGCCCYRILHKHSVHIFQVQVFLFSHSLRPDPCIRASRGRDLAAAASHAYHSAGHQLEGCLQDPGSLLQLRFAGR